MKAVILARVSSKEQEEGHSLDAQIKLLREYCVRSNLDIDKEYVIVESSTRGDRKEFRLMLDYVLSQKETVALVCHKVDRLQRSFNEYPLLNPPLQKGLLEIHFTGDNRVLNKASSPGDKFMWNVQIAAAQNFTDQISDNVKRSYKKKLEEGTITGAAPVGYLNSVNEKNEKIVVIDPTKAYIIQKIFKEYSTGLNSFDKLADMANNLGLTSRNGKRINKSTVEYMLKNPFYYGCMQVNNNLYPHIYDRLVSKDLWDKCQDIRKGKKEHYSKKTKTDFIFTGLIKCAKCGCAISPEIKKGKYVYLRPNTKKGCDCKQINEKVALEQIKIVLDSIKIPEALIKLFKEALIQTVDSQKAFKDQQINNIKHKLHDIENKQARLLDLLIDGSITKDERDKKQLQLSSEHHNLLERLKLIDSADERFAITVEYMVSLASRAYDLFESSGNDKKRRILNIVFSNLYLNGKTLEFSMRKPFDKLVNLPKGLNWLR